MDLLKILPDTEPIMRKTSRRIKRVDKNLRKLAEDMYETMVQHWGIGLAAIQVGVKKRLFVYEIPQRETHGYETCPPREASADGERETDETPEEERKSADDEAPRLDPGYTGEYTVCINPKIINREGSFIDDEGCLSREGWVAKVERAYEVTFQAYDLDMNLFEKTVTGLEARCVQHEIDHMDGILFTDRAQEGTLREISADEEEESEDRETVIKGEVIIHESGVSQPEESTVGRE
jgi:peptide deformylase